MEKEKKRALGQTGPSERPAPAPVHLTRPPWFLEMLRDAFGGGVTLASVWLACTTRANRIDIDRTVANPGTYVIRGALSIGLGSCAAKQRDGGKETKHRVICVSSKFKW